jgi:hypothetical protein
MEYSMKKFAVFIIMTFFLATGLFAQDRGLSVVATENLGASAAIGKQYALFIAIDAYRSWPALKKPVADAREIRDILKQQYYVDEVIELYNQQATRANITKTFTDLQSKLDIHDSLFIYYAGHGHFDEGSGTGFWIPVDGGTDKYAMENWLPNSQVRGLISRFKTIHVFMVSDSCFSGDILNTTRAFPPQIDNAYYRKAYGLTSRQVLTSGSSETVPDQSEFSAAIKNCLRKNTAPLLDPIGIYNDVRLSVRSTTPLYGTLNQASHQDGATFLFFRKQASQSQVTQSSQAAPSLAVSSAVGSITVNSEIAGEILIDGAATGNKIKTGGTITVNNVSVGTTEVAVRESNGKITKAPQAVMVRQGQTANVSVMGYVIPDWVQALPKSNDRVAYFVGKSERMENYENYLEAKAGALADVLMQFSVYKGAEVNAMFTDYAINNKSMQEDVSKINFNNDSAGMYQQAEWMDGNGILYVLYTYAASGKLNPKPDFPAFFKDYTLKKDKVYFLAKAVSPGNTNELSVQAEQNAKIQAILWLGTAITGVFTDYNLDSGFDSSANQSYFEGGIKCTSRINLKSISLQEESRYVQMEQDQKYHYYGLYSISTAKPGNTAEYECLTYNIKFVALPKLSFEKQINIFGDRFSHNKPFAARPNDKTKPNVPIWLNDFPTEDAIWGIGVDQCSDSETRNIISAQRSVTALTRQISSKVQATFTDNKNEDISRQISSINTFRFIKINEELTSDNSSWQLWQVTKTDAKKIMDNIKK